MSEVTRRKTAQEIDRHAADWAARIDRGALTDAENSELEGWLSEDPRHLGAFGRARAIAVQTERAVALGFGYEPDRFVERELPTSGHQSLSRRSLTWGGTAAAGLAVVSMAGYAVSAHSKTYTTLTGEFRVVPLDDGSVISLNTDSRVRVTFTARDRSFSLEKGEVFFDVASDARRPFKVQADRIEVIGSAAKFSISHLKSRPVDVLVNDGEVQIKSPGAVLPVLLSTNKRAKVNSEANQTLPETVEVSTVTPDEVKRSTAWIDGQIAFEGQPLGDAVQEFRRYNTVKILLATTDLEREEITGLFNVRDPEGFARAVATSFNLKVTVGENIIVLAR
ncbi:FecR family protein [Asticcacaulis sp. W401b]|uniref:FecR family protein n=1 Tax=Asticcacaulis sp. W401b TaxID=3388666 RepID=UPI003970BD5E